MEGRSGGRHLCHQQHPCVVVKRCCSFQVTRIAANMPSILGFVLLLMASLDELPLESMISRFSELDRDPALSPKNLESRALAPAHQNLLFSFHDDVSSLQAGPEGYVAALGFQDQFRGAGGKLGEQIFLDDPSVA